MKNKSLKLGLTYMSGKQIHGKDSSDKVLRAVKPDSEPEKTKSVLEDILRWADDGGQMIDIGHVPYPANSDTGDKRVNG